MSFVSLYAYINPIIAVALGVLMAAPLAAQDLTITNARIYVDVGAEIEIPGDLDDRPGVRSADLLALAPRRTPGACPSAATWRGD